MTAIHLITIESKNNAIVYCVEKKILTDVRLAVQYSAMSAYECNDALVFKWLAKGFCSDYTSKYDKRNFSKPK